MKKQLLKGGLLDTVLLDLISGEGEQGLHGYALILLLRKKFHVYISASTLYPELKKIEENGYISSSWNFSDDRPRHLYRITDSGQKLLKQYFVELKMIIPLMQNREIYRED